VCTWGPNRLGAGRRRAFRRRILPGVLVLLFAMRHFAEPVRRYLTHAIRFWPERYRARAEKLLVACVQGVESTRSDGALLA
jgi:predicted P-loop ATPase